MDGNYDAIIVLGMALDACNRLNTLAQERVALGAMCYKKHRCPIIVSGGGMSDISEAQCMFYALQNLNVNPQHILLEEESLDTLGNAYFTKKLFLEKNNWFHIMVVTSQFHIARTRKIFQHVLGKAFSIAFIGAKDCVLQHEKQRLYAMEKLFLDNMQLSEVFTQLPKRSDYKRIIN